MTAYRTMEKSTVRLRVYNAQGHLLQVHDRVRNVYTKERTREQFILFRNVQQVKCSRPAGTGRYTADVHLKPGELAYYRQVGRKKTN